VPAASPRGNGRLLKSVCVRIHVTARNGAVARASSWPPRVRVARNLTVPRSSATRAEKNAV